ncbi:chemotaxis protein CheW [Teredinibacter haidensis]|uniref:chemotaxis protein CheW n=1 Tax=Teredinibacter haidensis TaxID=2731755 RepID=UPI000948CD22|nr:chemotaxis protein CheW [Teredinibacter haidensis]
MSRTAFQALVELAKKSRQSARGLPSRQNTAPRWSGIGFSILGQRFVAPMNHVAELMEVPSSTRLPGVHSWVLGLSNVRGRLLPIFDLPHFFGGAISGSRKHHRVLVLETDILYSGIVVDRAFGMQHFNSDSFGDYTEALPETMEDFIDGSYRDADGKAWPVFSMAKLAEDSRFNNAALV